MTIGTGSLNTAQTALGKSARSWDPRGAHDVMVKRGAKCKDVACSDPPIDSDSAMRLKSSAPHFEGSAHYFYNASTFIISKSFVESQKCPCMLVRPRLAPFAFVLRCVSSFSNYILSHLIWSPCCTQNSTRVRVNRKIFSLSRNRSPNHDAEYELWDADVPLFASIWKFLFYVPSYVLIHLAVYKINSWNIEYDRLWLAGNND